MPKNATGRPGAGRARAPGGVAAVDRAVDLLAVFGVDRPLLSLAELAEGSGQYKSTASRLLASLQHAHVVERRADGRFGIGPAVARLHAVYAAAFSLEACLVPVLRDLVAATRESASYHVRQGDQRLCLLSIDSPQSIGSHDRVGTVRPLRAGVAGRVFAAGPGRPAPVRNLVAGVDVVPEASTIAAAVLGPDGDLHGVLALTMPTTRFSTHHCPAVADAAARATESLGGRPANAANGVRVPGRSGGTLVDRPVESR